MTVVKITVLETSLKKDLADEYAVPNLEPCPILKAGQVFYATNTCPKGMCDAAWRTITSTSSPSPAECASSTAADG